MVTTSVYGVRVYKSRVLREQQPFISMWFS